jgi:hypothetical protein
VLSSETISDTTYYTGGGGGGGGGGGVIRGREGYYLDAVESGDPAGVWHGSLAEKLGLTGEIDGEVMHNVYSRREGPNGELLGQRPSKFRTPEERLEEWVAANPRALPEEVAAQKKHFEDTVRKPGVGLDLTFSVQKSISAIYAAVKEQEWSAERSGRVEEAEEWRAIRAGIESGMDRANLAGMDYVSSRIMTRPGKHSGSTGRWVPGTGIIFGSFRQSTNRNGDPQLHTHNVIANAVETADGKILALDIRGIDAIRMGSATVFEMAMEEEMERLGFAMELRPDGVAREAVVVTEAEREVLSTRSREIKKASEEQIAKWTEILGQRPSDMQIRRIMREATLKTRDRKKGETEEEVVRRANANLRAEVGYSLRTIALRARNAYRQGPREAGTFSADAVVKAAVAAVSEQSSTWRWSQLRQEIRKQLPHLGGVDGAKVTAVLDKLTNQAIASTQVVQVAGKTLPVPLELVDAGTEFSRDGERLYASTDTLDGEDLMRRHSQEGGRFHLEPVAFEEWMRATYPDLSGSQRRALRGMATSDRAISLLIGPPGTGKSYVVGALSEAYRQLSDGGKLIAVTVSSKASEVLEANGVTARNIAAFYETQKRLEEGRARPGDEAFQLGPRDVLVVDEAAMVDTADMEKLRGLTDAEGVRLLPAGDPKQLSSIGAGGTMGLLEGHAETFHLDDVRRFQNDWEGEASMRLRDGDVEVLGEYDRRGRLVDAKDAREALHLAADAAAADRLDVSEDRPQGLTTLVVTATREEAAVAADLVRERLVAAGVVDANGVTVGFDGNIAGRGDVIMARKNNHRIKAHNRDRYEVTRVREDGSIEAVKLGPDGLPVSSVIEVLPAPYVAEHVALAYASTAHSVQGDTIDTTHNVFGGQGGASAFLVPMTRGRDRNTAYVAGAEPEVVESRPRVTKVLEEDEDGTPTKTKVVEAVSEKLPRSTVARLSDMLRRDDEEHAATVAREEEEALLASLETIGPHREMVTRMACRQRLDRHMDLLVDEGVLPADIREVLGQDQSTEHLSRLIRAAEENGRDPLETLRAAVSERGFDGVRNVAQVLSGRITKAAPVAEPTTARTPGDLSMPVTRTLEILDEKAAARERELGPQVVREQPAWALRHLGPVPEDQTEREEWEHRAGIVAGFREWTKFTDEHRAIGDAPGITATEKRAGWFRAWGILGKPEEQREEASMTEGQLRVWIKAGELAKQWAPEHGNDAWKVNEISAANARTAAILAGADPDTVELTERAEAAAVSSKARDAWLKVNGPTLEKAKRAEKELVEVRGVPVGNEPDLTTVDEYLEEKPEDALEVREQEMADVEVDEFLEGSVEERSGDLSMPEPRRAERVEGAEQARVGEEQTEEERTATVDRATAVLDEVDDLRSLDAQVDLAYPDPYEPPVSVPVVEHVDDYANEMVAELQ